VPKFVETLRRNRKVIGLFALMVLLPAAVFGMLIVRAFRGEQVRRDYETRVRQQQIIQLAQADLANWLFSAAPGGARSLALLRFELQGDRIVFPDFQLSLAATGLPQQRPFDAAPPGATLTPQLVVSQYLPRIVAFRRDVTAGRNAGAQYFRQLRALIVQPPGTDEGYIVELENVLAHVDATLTEFSTAEPFAARTWIAAERSSLPPAGAVALEGFPFFAVVFADVEAATAVGLRNQLFPYSLGLLVLVTVLGSVFVYRAVSHEVRLARLRNDFVAAVSHEFRSPLSSILALAERLERVSDPDRLREYHRIIGQDARRLSALVTRLLDFALIEDGKEAYAFERVDLVETTREAIEACQHVARPGRISLLGADAAPLWVHGDRTALQHAIQNVIENAAKYSPPEAPITVQCASANGSHLVEVYDRGIGIPAAEQTKIFEKFYRGQEVAALNAQGVGIGLALVQHVIKGHGGSIGVDSRPGEGSRFSLHVPKLES
jgi:signal transduction histidine kinase